MITTAQIRDFSIAQANVLAAERQLKMAKESAAKLEGGLLAGLEAGEKVQRWRLTLRINESSRRNVGWKEILEEHIGKAAVKAISAGTAPTITYHVVIEPTLP